MTKLAKMSKSKLCTNLLYIQRKSNDVFWLTICRSSNIKFPGGNGVAHSLGMIRTVTFVTHNEVALHTRHTSKHNLCIVGETGLETKPFTELRAQQPSVIIILLYNVNDL